MVKSHFKASIRYLFFHLRVPLIPRKNPQHLQLQTITALEDKYQRFKGEFGFNVINYIDSTF